MRARPMSMRAATAALTAVILLGLLALCPLPICAMPTAHACCHKSQTPQHCPLPTIQDCPYFILEKGKTAPTVEAAVPVACPQNVADLRVSDCFSTIRTEIRLVDATGLYLRMRVLLI